MVDSLNQADAKTAFVVLLEAQRLRCLWYLRPDWVPATVDEKLRVLDAIECHSDLAEFRESSRIRQWFSSRSNAGSASS